MKKINVLSAVIALALTVNGAVSAYAQAEQASTADGGAVADSVNAEVQESEADSKQAEEQIVKTAVSEENLPDSLDAETIIADGYVARLNSEEQSLSEIVLEKEDGTRSLYLFGENVKYIDENGDVADKSNNAVRRGNAYVNEGNDVEVILPATLTAGIAVTGDELNITMKPLADKIGRSLSPAVKTADDTVVYSDVFDSSTNIEYTYTYGGVKENIILESYNGKNSFDYEITTGGLSLYEDKGTLLLADESGDVKATLGEVVVFSADNKNNTFGKYKVEELEKNNRYKVTMIVDRAYLTDPDTKYPVKIDPDINSAEDNFSIQDLQVFKGADGKGTSETSLGTSGVSRVGWTDWGACRTLLKIGRSATVTDKITASSQVVSAYIEIRDLMCQSVSTPVVCAQFKGNNWTEKDVKTWNALNAGSAGSPVEIYRQSDTSNKSHAYNVKSDGGDSIRTKDGYGKQWYAWNITPNVKNWVNNSSNMQKGLVFMTASTTYETANYAKYMKTFSSMQGNATYKPYIAITYTQNTSISDSINFAVNTSKIVKIANAQEKRFFSFVADKSGYYSIESSSNGTADPYAKLLNSAKQQIDYSDNHGGNKNFHIIRKLNKDQRYYVEVGCIGSGTGTYTLRIVYRTPVTNAYYSPKSSFGVLNRNPIIQLIGIETLSSTWKPIIYASSNAWNSTKARVNISFTTSNALCTLKVNSFQWKDGSYGKTYYNGYGNNTCEIEIDSSTMKDESNNFKQSVITHELGHIFDLGDNPVTNETSLMKHSRNRNTVYLPTFIDVFHIINKYE